MLREGDTRTIEFMPTEGYSENGGIRRNVVIGSNLLFGEPVFIEYYDTLHPVVARDILPDVVSIHMIKISSKFQCSGMCRNETENRSLENCPCVPFGRSPSPDS